MCSYKLKYVSILGREIPIVMQNENGPCPLLAIANVLLLRKAIQVPCTAEVEQERLLSSLADYLLLHNPVDPKSEYAANLQQNLNDVISTMPKLTTGLDVNPKFNSVRGFEFTNEIAIFDLFDISLVHGWVIDPQEIDVSTAVGDLTYNQVAARLISRLGSNSLRRRTMVVEEQQQPLIQLREDEGTSSSAQSYNNQSQRLVNCELKISEDGVSVEIILNEPDKRGQSEEVNACRLIHSWLNQHQSQLSDYGLKALHDEMAENELAVFFRNNHFSTILKKKQSLYILVTDQGYLSESFVVWEQLGTVNNNNKFYNGEFKAFEGTGSGQSIDADHDLEYAIALSMQDTKAGNNTFVPDADNGVSSEDFLQVPGQSVSCDQDANLAYAMHLQEQEDYFVEQKQQERMQHSWNNSTYHGAQSRNNSNNFTAYPNGYSTQRTSSMPGSAPHENLYSRPPVPTSRVPLPDHGHPMGRNVQTLQESTNLEDESRSSKFFTKIRNFFKWA